MQDNAAQDDLAPTSLMFSILSFFKTKTNSGSRLRILAFSIVEEFGICIADHKLILASEKLGMLIASIEINNLQSRLLGKKTHPSKHKEMHFPHGP